MTKTVILTDQNAAANTSGKTAPVSEILSWISSHFELTVMGDAQMGTALSFQGCQATLTFASNSKGTSSGTVVIGTDKNIVGPFDLSNLRPDTIQTGDVETFNLAVKSVTMLPVTVTQKIIGGPFNGTNTSDTNVQNGFVLSFRTKDMRDRQAKAWHDAIIGCGGKAISDKLY